jgi:hypothetical protein
MRIHFAIVTMAWAPVLALLFRASECEAAYQVKPEIRAMGNAVLGKLYGDGECVALVREWTGAPQTAKWNKGAKVRGSKIPIGTAIATFNTQAKYEGHAAIYQSQDDKGINVIDQWKGRAAGYRHIRFQAAKADRVSNDGDAYYVIE